MQILMNSGGMAMTNCYLVADEAAKVAVLFDAPDHTALPLLEQAKARGWELIGLWLTHGHFDHIADHAVVTAHFPNAKVLMHRLDEPKLQHPGSQLRLFGLPMDIPARSADAHVNDGDTLHIGRLAVQVLHTPGHAPGHVVYHLVEQGVLIGGDLIFAGSVGRTDLPDSDHARLEASIRRVMKLPPGTHLLPGHGQATTLADERESNPWVREALRAGDPSPG